MKTEWTVKRAIAYLISSTLVTLIVSLTGFVLWKKHQKGRLQSEAYRITAIIQTGLEKDALPTAYLAEILGLSVDKPTQLYALNVKKAEALLLSSPLIANAKIKRMPPSTLYIDYEVRRPVCSLADFQNIALDREGHLFPITPFLSPKKLPEIYLGLTSWPGWHLKSPGLTLALEILRFLETVPWTEGLRIQRIDVSNAFASSLGTREVVLTTEEEVSFTKEDGEIVCYFPKILRLAPKDYETQLNHFFTLRRAMIKDYKNQLTALKTGGKFAPRIIDLRIPHLAFVEKG